MDERQQLIDAAWSVLDRSGFEGFKVQLVMREAGLSARAFYRHFPDKESLELALMRDEMDRASQMLDASLAAASSPVEQIEGWIAIIIGAAADPRRVKRARLFSANQVLFRRFPAELRAGTEQLMAPLRRALEQGAGADLPLADPSTDPELIYALVGGELAEALTAASDGSVDEVVHRTTSFVLRALGVTARSGPPR